MTKEAVSANGRVNGKEYVGRNPSVGVGILIYNPDIDSIWMIEEKTSKPESKKMSGQLSIPAETRKVGEGELANVYGGLSEYCSDRDIPLLSGHLYRVNTENGYKRQCTTYKYKGVDLPLDLAFIICDNAQILPTPSCAEVGAVGWVPVGSARKIPNIRSAAQEWLDVAARDGMIEKAMIDFKNPQKRKLLFPNKNFSIEMYSVIRELKTDMTAMLEGSNAESSLVIHPVEARSQA